MLNMVPTALKIFPYMFYGYLFVHVRVYTCAHHNACMGVRGQLAVVSSLLHVGARD